MTGTERKKGSRKNEVIIIIVSLESGHPSTIHSKSN